MLYDTKTVETVKGTVESIDSIKGPRGRAEGIHLSLKTEKETIVVHLGPSWYIGKQDVKIKTNDNVEVKGSRITLQGKPVILAAEVRKGNEVLSLRNAEGLPLWRGRTTK